MDHRKTAKSGDSSIRWRRRPHKRPIEIADAALAIFAEKGFDASTMDEVAEAAGISKGTIYLYYSSKEDLLVDSVEMAIRENQSKVLPILTRVVKNPGKAITKDGIREILKNVIVTVFDLITTDRNRTVIRVVMAERQRSERLRMLQIRLAKRAQKALKGFLSFAHKAGAIDCTKPEIKARLLMGLLLSYPIMNELSGQTDTTNRSGSARDAIIDFALKGIGIWEGGKHPK